MKTQNNNNSFNIVDKLSDEFKGHYFYGLEFVLDEIYDENEKNNPKKNVAKVDWFGLSDLII